MSIKRKSQHFVTEIQNKIQRCTDPEDSGHLKYNALPFLPKVWNHSLSDTGSYSRRPGSSKALL
jgi:hypothetical protein